MLPPGLARLSTYPATTGSLTATNKIGILPAADRAASNPMVLPATIRSGAKPTSSSAYCLARSGSPPDHRTTSETLRPSAHPNPSSAERKFSNCRAPCASPSRADIRRPTFRIGLDCCCARAVHDHAAALPTSVMNSRRSIFDPKLRSQHIEAKPSALIGVRIEGPLANVEVGSN